MTDPRGLIEVLEPRTSRRLDRASKRIRTSGATVPRRTGPVHTVSRGSAGRAPPGRGAAGPNPANRVHNRTAAGPRRARAPDLSESARSHRPLGERPGDRGNAGR